MLLTLAAVMIDSDDIHTGDADRGGGGNDRDGGPKPIPVSLYRCEFRGPSEGSILLTSGKGGLSLASGSAAAWGLVHRSGPW